MIYILKIINLILKFCFFFFVKIVNLPRNIKPNFIFNISIFYFNFFPILLNIPQIVAKIYYLVKAYNLVV